MIESIFREYDIRGLWEKEINEDLAYKIGYFFGKRSVGEEIILGFDGRHGAIPVFNALAAGIINAGAIPKSLGLVPTPLVYFANEILSPASSIMITASHNSKEYIGLKMLHSGIPFCGEDIQKLKHFVKNLDIKYTSLDQGRLKNISLLEEYLDRIFQNIRISPKIKVAWDIGNGAVGSIITKLVEKMPNENLLFNKDIDPEFSGRSPDPTNHKNLSKFVKNISDNNCDLGIAFDGDGDRVVFVTAKGNILDGDIALLIFARYILKKNPGATIISEVKASKVFFEGINNIGGRAVMSKTGHSNIKKAIKKHKAILAGELSCHFFFMDDYFGYDDAIYAALRMIDIISRNDISLDEILGSININPLLPEVKIKVSEDRKFAIVNKLKSILKEEKRDFIDLDGIRYEDENGWWLIRASNTGPAICIRAEALSNDKLAEIKGQILSYLKQLDIDIENSHLT